MVPSSPLPTYPQIYGRSTVDRAPSPTDENCIVITIKWTGLRNTSGNSHNFVKILYRNESPDARTAFNHIRTCGLRCGEALTHWSPVTSHSDPCDKSPDVATSYRWRCQQPYAAANPRLNLRQFLRV